MPRSTSSSGVSPLPPRVVSIFHGVLQEPSTEGLFITVPTNYELLVSDVPPTPDDGQNGDWFIYSAARQAAFYRKISNAWSLKTTIAGTGGGGVGGTYDSITITNSSFTNGTIVTSLLTNCVLNTPVINNPTITGLSISNPTLNNATLNNPTIHGGTITGATITGLPTPVNATDAVTKQYADGVASGFRIHTGAMAATTANVVLSGGAPSTLDGVGLGVGFRILVKDQTDPKQNGIYDVAVVGSGGNGTWTRSSDADADGELDNAYVLVALGTTNGGSAYVCTTTPPVLIGVSNVVWTIYYSLSSVPASKITGTLTAGQIGSVNAGTIIGTISAGQILSVNAGAILGSITSSQIGSVNASAITGSITSTQIGSVNATSIVGSITAGQILSVGASSITGSIVASQIGSVTAGTITGVIVTSQLANQILNTQRLIANDISVVRRVSSLPTLPNTDYPDGSLALLTTTKTLYQVVSGAWSVVTASSNVVGTLTSNDIASVNASSIIGLIIASQINSINASQIAGSITSSQIGSVSASAIVGTLTSGQISSVSASTITGTINSSQISSVNASAIVGAITSSQISSVNASSITGSINSSQIASVNATTITLGSLSAINYTVGSGLNQTTINSSGLTVGNLVINGASSIQSLAISGTYSVSISGGVAGAISIFNGGVAATMQATSNPQFTTTGGTSIIGSSDGNDVHLVRSGTSLVQLESSFVRFGHPIAAITDSGFTRELWTGNNYISFQWDSGHFKVKIDSTVTTIF